MQYAVMEWDDGRRIILDAAELLCLREYASKEEMVKDEEVDESKFAWKVVYGVIQGHPALSDDKLLGYFNHFKGRGFGRIVGGASRISEVGDFEPFEPYILGTSYHFPVAALIGTIDKIPLISKGRALTLFPRFIPQLGPLPNVLYRPGILSVRGEERSVRLEGKPTGREWVSHIKPDRAIRAAMACR